MYQNKCCQRCQKSCTFKNSQPCPISITPNHAIPLFQNKNWIRKILQRNYNPKLHQEYKEAVSLVKTILSFLKTPKGKDFTRNLSHSKDMLKLLNPENSSRVSPLHILEVPVFEEKVKATTLPKPISKFKIPPKLHRIASDRALITSHYWVAQQQKSPWWRSTQRIRIYSAIDKIFRENQTPRAFIDFHSILE